VSAAVAVKPSSDVPGSPGFVEDQHSEHARLLLLEGSAPSCRAGAVVIACIGISPEDRPLARNQLNDWDDAYSFPGLLAEVGVLGIDAVGKVPEGAIRGTGGVCGST
jgi:hypothetical protein